MGTWFAILALDMLIPAIMLIFGLIFRRSAPKDINSLYGYRTPMSTKNQDTWSFAHSYCGRFWLYTSLALIPVCVIILLFFIGKDSETVSNVGTVICMAQFVPLLGSIIATEIALRKNFERDGSRRADIEPKN